MNKHIPTLALLLLTTPAIAFEPPEGLPGNMSEPPKDSQRFKSLTLTQRNVLESAMDISWAAGCGDVFFVRINNRDIGPVSAHKKGGYTRPYDDVRWASPLDAACEIDDVWFFLEGNDHG